MFERAVLKGLLATAGVGIDGVKDHHLNVRDASFVWDALFVKGGTLALGEAYTRGDITATHIDLALEKLAKSWLGRLPSFDDLGYWLYSLVSDPQDVDRSKEVANHYDLSSRMYRRMLGPTMCYTSALGMTEGLPLDHAQERKVSRMVDELWSLRPGDRVGDVGCGYGTTMLALARKGASAVGISISPGQLQCARERTAGTNLPLRFFLGDYRNFSEKLEQLSSTEMIEAVGRRHLERYFAWAHSLLVRGDGREHFFTLQAITTNRILGDGRDGFLAKYIFPGGELPRYSHLERAWAPYFKLANRLEFGQDYRATTHAWRNNLAASRKDVVAEINEIGYRMMEFYLAICEVSFKLNINTVGQYTLVAK